MLNFPIWEPKWKFLLENTMGFVFADYVEHTDIMFGKYNQLHVDFHTEDFEFLEVATFLNN